MIDTETDFPDAPDGPDGSAGLNGGPFGSATQQLDFLAADLASVDRTVTPWVIVAGHTTMTIARACRWISSGRIPARSWIRVRCIRVIRRGLWCSRFFSALLASLAVRIMYIQCNAMRWVR
jgi:hypothetical protein